MSASTGEKKKRVDKKNRLTEIQKPRGFERGLEIDEIVGVTDYTGDLMFLIRWQNCPELDLLPAPEVNEKSPQDVIKFNEKRCPLNRKANERNLPNIPIIPIAKEDEVPEIVSKVEAAEETIEAPEPEPMETQAEI